MIKFVTSVYRKQTFSGIFTNYESLIPAYQNEDFYVHCYIGVSIYAVTLKHFI